MSADGWRIVIAFLGLALAFVSAVWVHGVSRLTTGRAARLAQEQPKRGELLVKLAENPPPYLAVALLAMLAGRVTTVVLAASLAFRWGRLWPEVVVVVVMVVLLFQVAELAPRSWVLERPDQAMLFSARPVYFLGEALGPVASMLVKANRIFMLILPGRGLPASPLTSEEEIKSMLEVAESEEVIEAEEAEMIQSIFEFGDTVVREIMVPRPDMVCAEATMSLDEVLSLSLKHGFSRIPVIADNIDNVTGIAHIRDVIKRLHNGTRRLKKVRDVARDAYFIPESKKVIELLREMQRAKTHMAIVVDEYGGTSGLVTLEDVLEEIVGEISDEYDREEPAIEKIDDDTLRVSARLSIDELNDLLAIDLPSTDWDSVGGLVGGSLGRVAEEGDSVTVNGVEFEVEKTKGRRIEKVVVHRRR